MVLNGCFKNWSQKSSLGNPKGFFGIAAKTYFWNFYLKYCSLQYSFRSQLITLYCLVLLHYTMFYWRHHLFNSYWCWVISPVVWMASWEGSAFPITSWPAEEICSLKCPTRETGSSITNLSDMNALFPSLRCPSSPRWKIACGSANMRRFWRSCIILSVWAYEGGCFDPK